MLEPDAGKLARPDLRGGSASNGAALPDPAGHASSRWVMIARFSVAAALAGFVLIATGVAHSQDAKDKPKLGSMRLVVVLKDKGISLKEKQYPLVIVFQSTTFKEQHFKRSEYFFAVLDRHGVQVENAVFLDDEDKEIVLKAGRTEDAP